MTSRIHTGVDANITPHLPVRYRMVRWFLRIVARTLFDVHSEGRENVPAGNYIVVANHLSWIDPFLLLVFLPAEPRIYFIGAQQAINRRWKAWLMRSVDMMIPIQRGASWMGKDAFAKPLQVLAAGAVLGIFPEGKVGPREGELQEIQRGIGHILVRADAPVVPVALSGVQELYWRKPIALRVGQPFRVTTGGLDHHAAIASAAAQVESALRQLIPPYVEPKVAKKRMRFLTNLLG